MAAPNTARALARVGAFLKKALAKEIVAQGHDLTGKLKNDVSEQIKRDGSGFTLDIFMQEYAPFVDKGVKASRIPYRRGSGAKSSKYISGLIDFIRKRGLATGDKEVKNIAFAIANNHKRYGMPTRSSKRFSRTGKRLEFVQEALDSVVDQITEIFADAMLKDTELIIESSFGNNN
ncbi:MAG: hypothetical protein QQN63_01985 [Nitrosopumilus sp.]